MIYENPNNLRVLQVGTQSWRYENTISTFSMIKIKMIKMIKAKFFTLIFISQGKNPIQMSVYYETLCPDSLHFLQNQLLPLLATTQPQPVPTSGGSAGQDHQPDFNPSSEVDIDSLLDIRLIPYGKAVVSHIITLISLIRILLPQLSTD